MTPAGRFVDLACLTYLDDESRTRRGEASALLEATPNLVDETIHAAAAAGNVNALRAHLDRDPSSVGAGGRTPLLALCYSRVPQVDALGCLELLLERGADPNTHIMIYDNRFTALTGVMGEGEAGPYEQPPHPEARAMAERLLDAGASPNESQGLYNTHFLPSNDWLELLLARGLTSDLDFLLGQACVQGFRERVELLLAHGVSPNGRNHYSGRAHLESALLEGHADIARLLIAAGAHEPTLSDADRFQVAVLANDAREASRLLVTTSDAMMVAARHGKLEAVEMGLALGLPIDGRDRNGLTALHHAASRGHLSVVKLLVERGASLDVRDPIYDGTPLGHARHMVERWPRDEGAEVVAFLEAAGTQS